MLNKDLNAILGSKRRLPTIAKCPNCGSQEIKPDKQLKNQYFIIQHYECTKCHKAFTKTQ